MPINHNVSCATVVAAVLLSVSDLAAQQPPDFQGRYIAAISDGDMRAYAYIDGQIGAKRGPDELALIGLPLQGTTPSGRIEVSNSVINPVYSLVAAPDGNTIYVAETHTAQEDGDEVLRDLQAGTTLRAVDVSNLGAPRVTGSIEVGNRPMGVDASADGRTLVLATKTPETPLTFVRVENGRMASAQQFALQNVSPMPELPDRGQLPQHAEWHPTADLIAVTLPLRGQVQFYRVDRAADGSVNEIMQWGNSLVTSKWPMSGKFSPDGRYFVSNDLQWGPDVEGFYVNAPPSQLTVIKLADLDAETPRHLIVGGVSIPRNAESMDFSPDGRTIATVNIGQTWIEEGAPGHTLSSLSLIDFNTETGEPRHAGDWEIQGILPEGVGFDASGRYIAVGIYEYDGPEPRRSALEFWRVKHEAGRLPRLVPTGYAVETGPGAHSLIVVKD